jgi:hypothetical protein
MNVDIFLDEKRRVDTSRSDPHYPTLVGRGHRGSTIRETGDFAKAVRGRKVDMLFVLARTAV